jgi:hypothetical protein
LLEHRLVQGSVPHPMPQSEHPAALAV